VTGTAADPERLQASAEEDAHLQQLRFMVDFALREIRDGRYTLPQSRQVVENVRHQALKLFPDKGDVFDLIYRPRFERAIAETFNLLSQR
jgi:hypothetical protein